MSAKTISARLSSDGYEDQQTDRRAVLLVTTVDIGEGKKGNIEIREGDDPAIAALEFCARHGLPESIVEPLTIHIEDNLYKNAQQKAETLPQEQYAPEGYEYQEGDAMYYEEHDIDEEDSYEDSSPIRPQLYPSGDRQPPPPSTGRIPHIPSDNTLGSNAQEAVSLDYDETPQQQQQWPSNNRTSSRKRSMAAMNMPTPQPTPTNGAAGYEAAYRQDHNIAPSTGGDGIPRPQPTPRPAFPAQHYQQHDVADEELHYYEGYEEEERDLEYDTGAGDGVDTTEEQYWEEEEVEHNVEMPTQHQPGRRERPLHRPASANSSLATEYYGRPMPTVNAARTAAAVAAPAPDRLYADHFRKQQMLEQQRRIRDLELQLQTGQVHCTPVSRALAAHRNAAGYGNYGERLYVEGRLETLRKERVAAEILKEEEEAELAQATFKPEISRMAQSMKEAQSRSGVAYWDRLYRKGATAKTAIRAEAIRREQEEQELKECRFKPETDARSNTIMKERRRALNKNGLPLYDKLYNEAAHRRTKHEIAVQRLPDEATFKPQINTSSIVLRDLLKGRTISPQPADVAERLLKKGALTKQKTEAARKALAAPIDPETGKEMFKPVTCRPPRFARNPAGAPIGEYLYAVGEESSQRVQKKVQAMKQEEYKETASKFVNPASERLMERLKRERFRAIFCYLGRTDPSTGHAPTRINLIECVQQEAFMNSIDPEVRADVEYAARLLARNISRLLDSEMDNESVRSVNAASPSKSSVKSMASAQQQQLMLGASLAGDITLEGFIVLMEEVLEKTKGIARQYLQPLPSTRNKFQEPTFAPEIDKRSLALAARLRPAHVPAHEVLYNTASELAARKEVRKKEMEEAKLAECSFKPVINAGSPSKKPPVFAVRPTVASTKIAETLPQRLPQQQQQESSSTNALLAAQLLQQQHQARRRSSQQQASRPGSGSSASYLDQHLNAATSSGRIITPMKLASPSLSLGSLGSGPLQPQEYYYYYGGDAGNNVVAEHALEDGIDAIERQIQEAMTRLNVSSERVGVVSSSQQQHARLSDTNVAAGGNLAASALLKLQASLDYQALFGSPSAGGGGEGDDQQPEVSEAESVGATTGYHPTASGVAEGDSMMQATSSLGGINPLEAMTPPGHYVQADDDDDNVVDQSEPATSTAASGSIESQTVTSSAGHVDEQGRDDENGEVDSPTKDPSRIVTQGSAALGDDGDRDRRSGEAFGSAITAQ